MKVPSGIKSRTRILGYYVKDGKFRRQTGFQNMLEHVLAPTCETISKKYAREVKREGEYVYYKLQGFDGLFAYPAAASFHTFAQVISEGFQPRHWHHYEIPETAVQKDDIIVDCGSAEGMFAFKYRHIARKIYAIEPLPMFVEALHHNFKQADNVEVLPIALGQERGEAILSLNSSGINSTIEQGGDKDGIRVKLETLDHLFYEQKRPFTYLKADLEGFEEAMIRGGLQAIAENKPRIAMTTYHIGQNTEELIRLLKSAVPAYRFKVKGIEALQGNPVMLHAWV